jgi:hypothetical protein
MSKDSIHVGGVKMLSGIWQCVRAAAAALFVIGGKAPAQLELRYLRG